MSSQTSYRRATMRTLKKIGDSEDLGIIGDSAAGSVPVWPSFAVGTSGVAGVTMGGTYSS